MRLTVIIGTPDSGKSQLAERLVCETSDEHNRFYIATMIPYGEEGLKRVEKHRRLREGKEFQTIEKSLDVDQAIHQMDRPQDSSVLLECISNLVANEMFERKTPEEEIVDILVTQVKRLADGVGSLYVVTNEFDISSTEDADTKKYIRCNSMVNKLLLQMADEVFEVKNEHI